MVTVFATVRLNANTGEKHLRDLTNNEAHPQAVIEGTGQTWEQAKEACAIPDGAQVMHWMQV